MISENSRRSLINLSQFAFNRTSEDVRSDLLKSIVESGLLTGKKKWMTAVEVNEVLSITYSIRRLPAELLKSCLGELILDGKVLSKDNGYYLTEDRRKDIVELTKGRNQLRINVLNMLISHIEEKYGKLSASQIDLLIKTFDSFFSVILTQSSSVLIKTLMNPENESQFLLENVSQILYRILEEIKDRELRTSQKEAIVNLLKKRNEDFERYLGYLIQNFVYFEILNLDPECQSLEKKHLSELQMFIDTNFILDLLLPARTRHTLAKEIVKLNNEFGVKMIFTSHTQKEFLDLLSKYKRRYYALRKRTTERGIYHISFLLGAFIESYFYEKRIHRGLTFDGYSLTFEKSLEKILAEKFSIKTDNSDYRELKKHIDFEDYYRSVSSCDITKDVEVVEHDALHLLIITELRKNEKPGIFGSKYYFLTHDRSLYCAYERMKNKGIRIQPPSIYGVPWLQFLSLMLPLNGFNEKTLEVSEAFKNFCELTLTKAFPIIPFEKLVLAVGPWTDFEMLSTEDILEVLSSQVMKDYIEESQKLIESGEEPKLVDESIAPVLNQKLLEKYNKQQEEIKSIKKELGTLKKDKAEIEQKYSETAPQRTNKTLLMLGILSFVSIILLAIVSAEQEWSIPNVVYYCLLFFSIVFIGTSFYGKTIIESLGKFLKLK